MLTGQLVVDVCARCDQIVISAHFIFPLSSGPATLCSDTFGLNSDRSIKLQDRSLVVVVLQVFLVVREKYVYEVLFCCILVLHEFFGIRKN